jgi:hypothetical protein
MHKLDTNKCEADPDELTMQLQGHQAITQTFATTEKQKMCIRARQIKRKEKSRERDVDDACCRGNAIEWFADDQLVDGTDREKRHNAST